MKKLMKGDIHPIVIFWLGVLTGAVLIALVFGYKMLDTLDYQDRVFRYAPAYSMQNQEAVSIGIPPGTKVVKPKSVESVSIGIPPGTKVR